MKKIFFLGLVLAVLIAGIVFLSSKGGSTPSTVPKDGSSDKKRIEYITSFGWKVSDTPMEKSLTLIPEVFSKTLEEYNDMQLKSGFDLKPLAGKEITRFSYKLLNHPLDKNYARVNIFVHKGKIVAADVSSTKLDGFMHSIEKNDFE